MCSGQTHGFSPFGYVICVVAGRWSGYLGMYVGRFVDSAWPFFYVSRHVAWPVEFVCWQACGLHLYVGRHVAWLVWVCMLAGMWPSQLSF